MTDLERSILLRFDTDETHGIVKHYRKHQTSVGLQNGSVCNRLARHLENTTQQRVATCSDNLVSDIVAHSLVNVDWQAIAAEFCS